jgi:hypothetical protein
MSQMQALASPSKTNRNSDQQHNNHRRSSNAQLPLATEATLKTMMFVLYMEDISGKIALTTSMEQAIVHQELTTITANVVVEAIAT